VRLQSILLPETEFDNPDKGDALYAMEVRKEKNPNLHPAPHPSLHPLPTCMQLALQPAQRAALLCHWLVSL
jgi:hypothetical protein